MAVQPPDGPSPSISSEERTAGMLCHLLALAGFLIPFGNIIGPLIVWSMRKDKYPLVNDQGKESLNFQISVLIYLAVSLLLIFVAIGILTTIALIIADVVLVIVAGVAASEGKYYRYPMTIRFIQ